MYADRTLLEPFAVQFLRPRLCNLSMQMQQAMGSALVLTCCWPFAAAVIRRKCVLVDGVLGKCDTELQAGQRLLLLQPLPQADPSDEGEQGSCSWGSALHSVSLLNGDH